jgi:hypothetical protein
MLALECPIEVTRHEEIFTSNLPTMHNQSSAEAYNMKEYTRGHVTKNSSLGKARIRLQSARGGVDLSLIL